MHFRREDFGLFGKQVGRIAWKSGRGVRKSFEGQSFFLSFFLVFEGQNLPSTKIFNSGTQEENHIYQDSGLTNQGLLVDLRSRNQCPEIEAKNRLQGQLSTALT